MLLFFSPLENRRDFITLQETGQRVTKNNIKRTSTD